MWLMAYLERGIFLVFTGTPFRPSLRDYELGFLLDLCHLTDHRIKGSITVISLC